VELFFQEALSITECREGNFLKVIMAISLSRDRNQIWETLKRLECVKQNTRELGAWQRKSSRNLHKGLLSLWLLIKLFLCRGELHEVGQRTGSCHGSKSQWSTGWETFLRDLMDNEWRDSLNTPHTPEGTCLRSRAKVAYVKLPPDQRKQNFWEKTQKLQAEAQLSHHLKQQISKNLKEHNKI